MKQIRREVISYELENGFFVDVEVMPDEYVMWLYHNNGSIKEYMFGLKKESVLNVEELERIIESNVGSYIADYVENYPDDLFDYKSLKK